MTFQSAAENYDENCLVQEAVDNFIALVDDADYAGVLNLMGIDKFQFLKRKQMRVELTAVRMALWRLALSRSFPKCADFMFDEFLTRYSASNPGKAAQQAVSRAREYWIMIEPTGDSNFHSVAHHLASFIAAGDDRKSLTLKLALHLRRDYRFIFDHLISV